MNLLQLKRILDGIEAQCRCLRTGSLFWGYLIDKILSVLSASDNDPALRHTSTTWSALATTDSRANGNLAPAEGGVRSPTSGLPSIMA